MSYTYLLAGEDLELAQAELNGFLKSQGVQENSVRNGKLAETDSEPAQLRRLALTHEIGQKFYEGKLEEFDPAEFPAGSFKVRREVLAESDWEKNIESELGSAIESDRRKVDLENPDHVYKVYLFSDKIIVSRIVENIDRSLFEERSNEKRPFSSPVSLDPVLARVMVNLAEVPAGEHIIDPFCGTGGILIEAGLCGIGVNGADISEEMIEGSGENLEKYGILNYELVNSDIENIQDYFDRKFFAVVSDLPYGKSSRLEGKPIEYFSSNWSKIADRAVFCYDQDELGDMTADFELYVHKNLTRYIFIQDRS